jgi:hypothetical protein
MNGSTDGAPPPPRLEQVAEAMTDRGHRRRVPRRWLLRGLQTSALLLGFAMVSVLIPVQSAAASDSRVVVSVDASSQAVSAHIRGNSRGSLHAHGRDQEGVRKLRAGDTQRTGSWNHHVAGSGSCAERQVDILCGVRQGPPDEESEDPDHAGQSWLRHIWAREGQE